MATFTSVSSMVSQHLTAGTTVSTQGYYTPLASISAPKGAGVYDIVTLAQYGGTPDEQGAAFTLANGNVAVLRINGAVDVLQFGAKTDGSDVTAAFQAAANASTGAVFIPAGVYTKNTVTTVTNKHLTWYGEGSSQSIIQCVASDGFVVDSTLATDKEITTFKDLGLESTTNGIQTGVTFTGQGTSALGKQLLVSNCSFSGVDNATTWVVGVDLIDGDFSEVVGCYFRGNTGNRSALTSCIKCTDTGDSKFLHNYYYWSDVAVDIRGFSEGITVSDSHFVPCSVGVRNEGTGNLTWVKDCHINAYVQGVIIGVTGVNGTNHCHVSGNLIFKNAASTSNFIAIDLRGKKPTVIGNEILIPGSIAAGGNADGIVLGADVDLARVAFNQIADMANTGILISAGATDNKIIYNTYLNNGTNVVDSGTGTVQV